jgi:hypothetical protein
MDTLKSLNSLVNTVKGEVSSVMHQAIPDNPNEPVPALTPRALVVVFDPDLGGGKHLLQAPETAKWSKVDALVEGYIADVAECSGGQVKYSVVERLTRNYFPVKEDGFAYTGASYTQAMHTFQYHSPDWADYRPMVKDLDLLTRIARGDFDEVWFFGGPGFGFYESRMAGPGGFWCNAPAFPDTDAAGKRFVIMGFSYERTVGEMLENLGHRAESMLDYRWRHIPEPLNLWKKFARHKADASGPAEVGMMHWAPNSVQEYEWGNPTPVDTHADAWLNYPDLSAPPQRQTCAAWGGGEIRLHHKWWLKRLPKAPGRFHSVANSWWRYVINPNDPEF